MLQFLLDIRRKKADESFIRYVSGKAVPVWNFLVRTMNALKIKSLVCIRPPLIIDRNIECLLKIFALYQTSSLSCAAFAVYGSWSAFSRVVPMLRSR